ncbi:hypothetical protein AB0K60_10585 [Thermopolyspora sp. NPDC052614]|uniref:hypothetical protein n=1 Tax=Thermopolyspora sp. NPDC052614 TaxID=3155682 RepID=UPI003432304F
MHDRNHDPDDQDRAEFGRLLYDSVPPLTEAESDTMFAATMDHVLGGEEPSDVHVDDAAFAFGDAESEEPGSEDVDGALFDVVEAGDPHADHHLSADHRPWVDHDASGEF